MAFGNWKRLFLASFVVGLAACSPAEEAQEVVLETDASTLRQVATGTLLGFADETSTGTAHVWRNVPFAAAPVGDLRWRAPRAAANWDGVRTSLEQPAWCVQYTHALDNGFGFEPGTLVGSEDCLYLNVYAPPFTPDGVPSEGEQLPVMVWIHGGGNTWGRAEQYDASELAARYNVIVVVAQYRLGPLGWLAHPALRATAQTPLDESANFGTLDLIKSLEWVQGNISAFGGDASRVTIFGESAGGHNVASLLAAPPAAGLFHRAIIQSGSLDTVSLEAAQGTAPMPYDWPMVSSQEAMNSILQFVQAPEPVEMAAAMRSLDIEALFGAYHEGEGNMSLPRVIADGIVLPVDGMEAAFAAPDTFNAVPVMTGSNRDETRLFNLLDPRFVNNYFGIIYVAKSQRLYDAISDYQSMLWRVRAVDTTAQAMVGGGHDQVYAYRFDWDEEGSFLISDFGRLMGAAHGMEIPFIFGNFSFAGDADRFLFTQSNEETRVELSDAMMSYWAEFARSGHPGAGRGTPQDATPWDAWGSAGAHMVLDTQADGGLRMEEGALSGTDVLAAIAGDARLENVEERCLTYGAAIAWFPQYADETFLGGACASSSLVNVTVD